MPLKRCLVLVVFSEWINCQKRSKYRHLYDSSLRDRLPDCCKFVEKNIANIWNVVMRRYSTLKRYSTFSELAAILMLGDRPVIQVTMRRKQKQIICPTRLGSIQLEFKQFMKWIFFSFLN